MNLIPINPPQFLPVANANLFPLFMALNNSFTWNVQSGSGSGSNILFNGDRVLRITSGVSVGVVINSGDTQTEFTASFTGTHTLSFGIYEGNMGTASTGVTVNLYVNGTPVSYLFSTLPTSAGRDQYRYFFAPIDLETGDVVSIGFVVGTNDVGTTYKLYFKNFKIEQANDSGFPTVYSPPANIGFTGTFLTGDDPQKTATVVQGKIITIV